ncbi:ATP synthase F1 subunit gamma [bacterium]|nr:ATP synthase F1 subunit gamma [bacterium]NBX97958.1 ATP synthase F1 subunit gamma [bacterium]NDC94409.1 ATP synthase F1 subunit gamma [bacterium]NDD83795.1 ATP synthase F1 subunit gamma [bacterium]NDG28798.1 ATP synthase F1 subunit gamma [bacterium]
MASTQILQRRRKSVQSTRQITKAMELVAASKMRRATEVAQQGRSYRKAAHELLSRLSTVTDIVDHPLYTKREVKTRLYVAITSDRGLAGAYNSNIIKLLTKAAQQDQKDNITTKAIIIGNRGVQFIKRIDAIDLLAAFPSFGDHPTANDIRPILTSISELYENKEVDDVQLLYTVHQSNIAQVATSLSLLPARVDVSDPDAVESLNDVTFEPSITAVLDNVTERLLEVQIWQAMLESIASEHSMRMLSMKNATDNANDLIDDLTLAFNTARQANITQEIAEVTGGAEAMK